jgi:tRNA acetyltransferase TAN1
MYSYNLLISYRFSEYDEARNEVIELLKIIGDDTPTVEKTDVKGIIGVNTVIESRAVVSRIRAIFREDPTRVTHAVKWVPVDSWCNSELETMLEYVRSLKDKISEDETWAMDLEKRKYPDHHTYEIVTRLSEPFKQKVNLKKPDKYLRIDIIGEQAGISVLKPDEIFSIARG